MLLEQSDLLFKTIMELEMKNYFVIAYNRFVRSKDYNLYLKLKEQQLVNNSEEIKKRIEYLENYGPVSDVIYLKNSCDDVKKYLNLRKLNKKVNNQISFINNKSNKCKTRVKIS